MHLYSKWIHLELDHLSIAFEFLLVIEFICPNSNWNDDFAVRDSSVQYNTKSEHGEAEKPLLQKKIIYNNLFEIEDAL